MNTTTALEGGTACSGDHLDLETLAALTALPQRMNIGSAWQGHIPFARWLIHSTKPRSFAELGVHWGDSYCAVCEVIDAAGISTRAYGIDSWLGDPHAGHYGEEVYEDIRRYHDPKYGSFSTLIRSTFAEAREKFEEGSIDILHIDGCHTYEAVREDFETWAPKMSARGVVLFHDTQVKEKNFGVWKCWHELERQHPSFEFHHSSGLGVLCVGEQIPAPVEWLTELAGASADNVRAVFEALGDRIRFKCRSDAQGIKIIRMEQSLCWYVPKLLRRIRGVLNRFAERIRKRLHG